MASTRADILLHPVRLRILQAMELGERRTAQQLGEILADVPQASVYRHLKKLVDAGFLQVVEERPVGGAIEKVYAIVDGAAVLSPADLASAGKQEHMRYFAAFCAMLMSKFGQYLERDQVDLYADGVGYRAYSLYLSDEELHALIDAMREPFMKAAQNKPSPERRRRLLVTILMPEDDMVSGKESS